MKTLRLAALCLTLLCAAIPARAAGQAGEYAFDPPHCAITFQVRHIFVNVPGRFADFGGVVRFDPANLAGSVFDVAIKAASLDTFVEQRNAHLRSPDFFDTQKFPEIRFRSSAIERVSDTQFLVKGTLTLKGASREIVVPLTFFPPKPSPMDPKQEVAGFTAKLDVSMPDYAFCDPKWSVMGVMGDSALVEVNFEMIRKP